ncbi:hypothetical protein TNCT_57191 [Trichonephila clavata]|uniref:Uncharacterized protein n=1 Tax=Trichonephila clavata TaxID=2740835 RepID=A0A8X6FE12_TRICU|nr:hypothetical protein TNCT_57191 [Trichonephila clavata]
MGLHYKGSKSKHIFNINLSLVTFHPLCHFLLTHRISSKRPQSYVTNKPLTNRILSNIFIISDPFKYQFGYYDSIPKRDSYFKTLLDSLVIGSCCQQSFFYSHEIPVCFHPRPGLDVSSV